MLLTVVALPGVTSASTALVKGRELRIKDNTNAARRAMTVTLRDVAIDTSGSPSVAGATVQLVNPITGEESSPLPMPAGLWKCRRARCAYRDRTLAVGPVKRAVVTNGRLRIVAAGAGIDYAVLGRGKQGAVGVDVAIGGDRVCAMFGGAVRKDDPAKGAFVAADAPAPASCAAPPTTSTTSSTSTTLPASSPTGSPIALSGCASSGYTAPVTIGGATTFALVVDSGSTTLGVASTQCTDCTGLSPLYAPGPSATTTGTSARTRYQDGSSWTGPVVSDLVALAGTPPVHMTFVAIDAQGNFFHPSYCTFVAVPDAYQGIIGLGGARLAVPGTDGYVDGLTAGGAVADLFAVQLCGASGRLWLGTYDPSAMTAPLQYTPMLSTSPYYAVTLSDVRVGSASLGFGTASFGPTIVDTGTSLLLLPSAVFSALGNAAAASPVFQQNFGGPSWFSGTTCVTPAQRLTKSELDAMLPPLTLTFPSAAGAVPFSVVLPATASYLLRQDDAAGVSYYCPGIAESPMAILGANALRSLITVFDRHGAQVGFAPEQGCDAADAAIRAEAPLRPPSAGGASRPAPPYRHPRTP